MNLYVVVTDDTIDDAALLAALEVAGIEAQVKPLHLQRAAQVSAEVIAEYPPGEQGHARDILIAWMDEALDAADDARLKRITDNIERLKRDHGELVTWRCPGGYIVLDMPLGITNAVGLTSNDAYRLIRIRELTDLLLPQLERIAPSILQGVIGVECSGDRSDYERLVALACREIFRHQN
ncbi:hypothetical protein ELY33_05055 [Vreelandella andesensis]|uniref:Uncharacterized protein n=1 Tax=Vreelandella andesensis TaxID=447567 RepID=A0A3S0YYN1_9GAMM|nr:hypothetical protein [Halomonas andesensis]RUR32750.1 hypothetical protein ELY33_05055 [Halomonas andesensis]